MIFFMSEQRSVTYQRQKDEKDLPISKIGNEKIEERRNRTVVLQRSEKEMSWLKPPLATWISAPRPFESSHTRPVLLLQARGAKSPCPLQTSPCARRGNIQKKKKINQNMGSCARSFRPSHVEWSFSLERKKDMHAVMEARMHVCRKKGKQMRGEDCFLVFCLCFLHQFSTRRRLPRRCQSPSECIWRAQRDGRRLPDHQCRKR